SLVLLHEPSEACRNNVAPRSHDRCPREIERFIQQQPAGTAGIERLIEAREVADRRDETVRCGERHRWNLGSFRAASAANSIRCGHPIEHVAISLEILRI